MKKLMAALLMFLPLAAVADPAPFGLEIGKTTVKEMTSKYGVTPNGVNKYSNGPMFKINVAELNFSGLKEATAIFSTDGVLLAILTTLPKSKFDYLLDALDDKYKLVSKKIPFVGNKKAKLIDGNTEITLSAPHMSFDMEMNYISKELWRTYKQQSSAEKEKKRKNEASQL